METRQPENKPAGSKLLWPAVVLLSVLILAGAGVYVAQSAKQGVVDGATDIVGKIVDVFRPKLSTTTIRTGEVTDVRFNRELIVTRAKVVAEVKKADTLKIMGVYFGTSVTRVRASDCRVQYTIDLNDFGTSNVIYDKTKKTLKVYFPEPRLDHNIVEVPLDQIECETSSGWARFNGPALEEQAKRELRGAAIEQGEQSYMKSQVREDASKAVRGLLAPITDPLGPDVRVDIEWVPGGTPQN